MRVNSQSGKGGIAYLLQRDLGVTILRRMQVEFSAIVQKMADSSETALTCTELWELFQRSYLAAARAGGCLVYIGHQLFEDSAGQGIVLQVELPNGQQQRLGGIGNGPIDAAVAALGLPIRVDSYEERSLGGGAGAQAMALVEVAWPGVAGSRFGAGSHANIVIASIQALLVAVSRFEDGGAID
nr:alpha-isopropylmalate synthase regulatory domain-containing protein [Pseudomonas punonensis]